MADYHSNSINYQIGVPTIKNEQYLELHIYYSCAHSEHLANRFDDKLLNLHRWRQDQDEVHGQCNVRRLQWRQHIARQHLKSGFGEYLRVNNTGTNALEAQLCESDMSASVSGICYLRSCWLRLFLTPWFDTTIHHYVFNFYLIGHFDMHTSLVSIKYLNVIIVLHHQ